MSDFLGAIVYLLTVIALTAGMVAASIAFLVVAIAIVFVVDHAIRRLRGRA